MTHHEMLRAQLREVAERRAVKESYSAVVKARRVEFEASIADMVEVAQIATQACAEAEDTARALTVAIYQTTDEKKPAEGAAIRVTTRLQYDAAEAFAKAKAMGVAIIPEQLDAKAFDRIAKASPASFPFVTVLEEPSATLASDLSSYLTAAVEPEPEPIAPVVKAKRASKPKLVDVAGPTFEPPF